MKVRIRAFPVFAAVALAAILIPGLPAAAGGGAPVTAMTWNLYFGFDEGPLFLAAATDPELIPAAVSAAWAQVQKTDFHVRAAAIAKKVKAAKPDLIALQEAVQYMRFDGSFTLLEVIDHIQILVEALEAEGLHYAYEDLNVLEDTDVTLPDNEGNYIRVLDRTAILRRVDLPPGQRPLAISNPKKGTFKYLLPPFCVLPGQPCLVIKRGWVSVDVDSAGAKFRFVTAHLEDAGETPDPLLEQLQLAQAFDLVTGDAFATPLPVVLMGDFNTDGHAKWATYQFLTGPPPDGAGLGDAWLSVHPKDAGLTWGPDPDLLAPFPPFTQRLDLALLAGAGFRVVSADVVGNTRGDRASTGMWPSDHAGLVLKFVP